jgi:hypothetical protein
MSTLLHPVRTPDVPTLTPAPDDARLGVTDRLALRLGLWLLLRSADRLHRNGDHDAQACRRADARNLALREHSALRQHLLAPRV